MATAPITTKNKAIISKMKYNAPCEPLEAASPKIAPGNLETIPIIINNDIPLPIPLSVILSPIHIQNMVPATKIKVP